MPDDELLTPVGASAELPPDVPQDRPRRRVDDLAARVALHEAQLDRLVRETAELKSWRHDQNAHMADTEAHLARQDEETTELRASVQEVKLTVMELKEAVDSNRRVGATTAAAIGTLATATATSLAQMATAVDLLRTTQAPINGFVVDQMGRSEAHNIWLHDMLSGATDFLQALTAAAVLTNLSLYAYAVANVLSPLTRANGLLALGGALALTLLLILSFAGKRRRALRAAPAPPGPPPRATPRKDRNGDGLVAGG